MTSPESKRHSYALRKKNRVSKKYDSLRDLTGTEIAPIDGLKAVANRDAGAKVIAHLAQKLSPGIVIALDGSDTKGDLGDVRTDTLIIFDGETTAIVPLRFTKNLFWIDGQPIFVAREDGVEAIADAILTEVENFEWRKIR